MPEGSPDNQNTKLVKEYAVLSTRVADALIGLNSAIKDINDTSVLHSQALNGNTQAIKSIEKFWGSIVKWLTIAIIILAGVEKASKLFGL